MALSLVFPLILFSLFIYFSLNSYCSVVCLLLQSVITGLFLIGHCLRVSVALKKHHHLSNSYKGKHFQFGGLVHCRHGRWHGSMQANLVLENIADSLYLVLQQQRETLGLAGFLKP